MTHRTIIIGDIHGCIDETRALLAKCDAKPTDHVIFLGDLVDRGPDSAAVVDLAMHREKLQGRPACILGNHEECHLFYEDVKRRKGRVNVQVASHVVTRTQLKPHHYDYFRTLPKFLRLPEYNIACVHAGAWPGRPLEQQTDRHLLHIQAIRPYDERGKPRLGQDAERSKWMSKVPTGEPGWGFWSTFWDGPERLVFGHSVLNEPLVTDKVIGLDGGGVFGRELWALVLPDFTIVRQPCPNQLDPNNPRRRGGAGRTLNMITDTVGTY